MSVQAELVKSLYTGFIDYNGISLEEYRPKRLVNDYEKGHKVLTTIIKDKAEESLDYIFTVDIFNDESHRAGAESYQKTIKYFEPTFLLGMTATPERTDAYNICEDFDYNIAYEIRLQQDMQEDMLCPFHYFGVTEMTINGNIVEDNTEFKYLVSEERVRNIIEKIQFSHRYIS